MEDLFLLQVDLGDYRIDAQREDFVFHCLRGFLGEVQQEKHKMRCGKGMGKETAY